MGYPRPTRPNNPRPRAASASLFRTNVARHAKRAAGAIAAYDGPRERVIEAVRQYCDAGAEPTVMARAIEKILRARKPRLRYRVGSDVRFGFWMRRLLPESVFQPMVARWYGV